jgi:hypothetical protein
METNGAKKKETEELLESNMENALESDVYTQDMSVLL